MNKYLVTPIKQRVLALFPRQAQVDEWAAAWKFFFILGFGRSGTAFMAHLLNGAPGAHVFHEPVLEDFYAHARAHYSPRIAERYIQGFRKREMYVRVRDFAAGTYGEVNGTLRCHADALIKAFPGAAMLHLVRDGRDVVRSSMSRRTMTIRNPFSMSLHPVDSDPWLNRWSEMDRFARICWLWQEENRRIRNTIGGTFQFEKVLSSYEYFEEQVLDPCRIRIEKKTWEAAVVTPRNISKKFDMPKWEDWTPARQKTFREICGAEMAACGYEF